MSDLSIRMTLQENVSSQLTRISSSARTTASQLQQAGRQIDQAFRTNSPEQFARRLGNAIDAAEDDAASLGEAIEEALDSLNNADFDIASGIEEAVQSTEELAEAAENAGRALREGTADRLGEEMNRSAQTTGRARDALGRFTRQARETADSSEGLGNQVAQSGETMERAVGQTNGFTNALQKLFAVASVAVISKKVGDFVSDSVSIGRDFTSMMSEVQAISGASQEEFATLQQTAREYGAITVFSATEAAEALKYMSLAGWDADQSSSALGGVLNLAAASGMGLGQASDMVTDYLSAFGMEASKATYFADMLSYAQSNSNTTAEQLGEAYRNSAANLNAAGQDVETTTSLLEAMANQGYKGSEAGTALAAMMRDITQKMDEGAIKIGDTSIAVQDAEGNFRDLTDILTEVEDATNGMGDAQRAAALGGTFTADSIKAMNMILTEGMDKISGYEAELRAAGGTAEKMADIMNDNLNGDIANMSSAFEEMKIQVFEGLEGPLREGVQYITNETVPALTEWVPNVFSTIANNVSKFGAALKPLFETLLKNPKAIGTAFASIGAGIAVFKSADIIKNLFSASGAIGSLVNTITTHPIAAGAAALVSGILAIKGAVEQYNDLKVEESLNEHFGSIELSESEISDMASRIIGVDWLANVNLALNGFENAEQFHQEATDALNENKKLLWNAKVQTDLEQAGDPVNPFITVTQGLLEGREETSGLSYDGIVTSTLEPDKTKEELAEPLVTLVNEAVSGAEKEELEPYAKDLAAKLTVNGDDNSTLVQGIVDFANGVVNGATAEELQTYVDTINTELGAQEGALTFESALSTLLDETVIPDLVTVPEYKDTVSVKLTPQMAEEFKTNIETFLTNEATALEEQTFAVKTSLETVLGEKAGSALLTQVKTWAAEDTAEMETLSSSLTALVEEALEDGVLDVEEQAAIDILQTKINNILSGWQSAQAEAEWQTLEMKWSGKDLTPESFTKLVENTHDQIDAAMVALDADTTEMNAIFNSWENSGKIDKAQRDQIKDLWTYNYKNMEGEARGRALSFETKSVTDTYGDLIEDNLQSIHESGSDTMNQLNAAATNNDWTDILTFDTLSNAGDFYSKNGGEDREALNQIYETLKPDVEEMETLIDSYAEKGQEIPKAIMDSYNRAIEIGAASGDESAAWQQYANSILESGNEELIDALTNENNPMYQTLRDRMAPELAEAIDRSAYAAKNMTDSTELSEMFNRILGLDNPDAEIDLARLSELLEKYNLDISEYLKEKGIDLNVNPKIKLEDFSAEEIAEAAKVIKGLEYDVTLEDGIQYTITEGTPTVWSIAEQLGNTPEQVAEISQKILEANGWSGSDAQQLEIGQKVIVPMEYALDEALLEESAGKVADEASSKAGEIAEAASSETPEVDAPANVNYTKMSDNSEEVYAEAEEDLGKEFEESVPTDGEAKATFTQTNNAAEIYNQANSDIQKTFAKGFNASANVNILLTPNYSYTPANGIEPPVSFHADGGIFYQPHFGIVAEAGAESIIPLDRSERSLSLWEKTGQILGIHKGKMGESSMSHTVLEESSTVNRSSSKTININFNGSGNLRVSGEMSKSQVINIMMENMKEVLMNIVEQEVFEEGDYTYEY